MTPSHLIPTTLHLTKKDRNNLHAINHLPYHILKTHLLILRPRIPRMRSVLAPIFPRETFSSWTENLPNALVIEDLPAVDDYGVTVDGSSAERSCYSG